MTQPEYVPVRAVDEVRPVERLPAPRRWTATRPADIRSPQRPAGPALGTPGPDQGYALTLAHRFHGQLALTEGESEEDAVVGCVAVAMRRAALFGRAPVVHDLRLAFTLFGYLGAAPEELVEYRRPLFAGAGHHYWDQRVIADRVPEQTLRMTPDQVAQYVGDWQGLLGL